MAGNRVNNKSDSLEVEKRVYKVSLMLRRKPISAIVDYIKQEWGLERGQAYNYINLAREEWQKYFDHIKISGMGYYVAQLRDLKDQAYRSRKVVVRKDNGEDGKKGDKQIVTIPNLNLVFEITKEEAKLMGAYPAEVHDVNIIADFASWVKKAKKAKDKKGKKGKK